MSLFTKLGNDIAAPVDAAGNPRAVDNGDMQRWMTEAERLFVALAAEQGGSLTLPNLLIRYTITGGTANAIEATTNLPVPSAPGEALYAIQIAQDNTGPVTINGKPWRTNTGNEFVAGGVRAGGIYLFLDNGDHFRALTDQDVSALVAQAEADATRAEAARDAALGAVPNAFVTTRAALAALDTTTVTAAYLTEPRREGQFLLDDGDLTDQTILGVVVPASVSGNSFVMPSITTVAVNADMDRFSLDGHGLTNGTKISPTTTANGYRANRNFWVVNAFSNNFQISDEPNGRPFNVTLPTTPVVTFYRQHSLNTGDGVMAMTAANGLTTDVVYYAIASGQTFSLAATYEDALAGNAITLTGSTPIQFKRLRDPAQNVFVIPQGRALDGSQGSWVADLDNLNAFHFGAKGDGVTDDTDAINRYLRFTNKINLPAGTFIVMGILNSDHDVLISGAGPDKTIIKARADINRTPVILTGNRSGMRDLTVDGSGDVMPEWTAAGDGANCIGFFHCRDFHLTNVKIINAYNKQLVGDNVGGLIVLDGLEVDGRSLVDANQDGIQIYGGTEADSTDVIIRNSRWYEQTRAPLYFDTSVRRVTIENNKCKNRVGVAGGSGVVLMGYAREIVITGNTFEDFKHGVLLRCGVGSVLIEKNKFLRCRSNVVAVDAQTAVFAMIRGNDKNWREMNRQIGANTHIILAENITIRDNYYSFQGPILESSTSGLLNISGFNNASYWSTVDKVLVENNTCLGATVKMPQMINVVLGAQDFVTELVVKENLVPSGIRKAFVSFNTTQAPDYLSFLDNQFIDLDETTVFYARKEIRVERNKFLQFRNGLANGTLMHTDSPTNRILENVVGSTDTNMGAFLTAPTVVAKPGQRYFIKGNAKDDGTPLSIFESANHPIPLMDEVTSGGNRWYLWMDTAGVLRRSAANTVPTTYDAGTAV